MAIGWIRCTDSDVLSPGITISVPCRQGHFTRYVRGTEIELRTIFVKERRVTATLFLAQYINLTLELGMRSDRTGFAKHHPAADLVLFNTTQQQTGIVTSFTLIQQLAEHFDTRYRGASGAS
jgi:hypothetical protein